MTVQILVGDVFDKLAELPDESVHCVVTSPPYWGLRDYGVDGQIGLEPTLGEHLEVMVKIFAEVHRVLRKDGTCWINYGDCYATSPNGRSAADTKAVGNDDRTFRDKPFSTVQGSLKPKDLCMIPNRMAIALQEWNSEADREKTGYDPKKRWWIRSEIIWHKKNPMPESITDRPATSHEKMWLLTKSPRYFYDADAVRVASDWNPDKTKTPDGWDTGPGAHGSVHHKGREKGKKVDKQRGHGRRHAGFNDRWDKMTKEEQQANGRNLRNVWSIATKPFSEAHFATFPPKLVEPCIEAGTSEFGVCPECGAPWKRQTEKSYHNDTTKDGRPAQGNNKKDEDGKGTSKRYEQRTRTISTTLGWGPQCKCDSGKPIPATVLDPFGGAGTTGLVADRLDRDCILIELNPEYADIARKRISSDSPLFAKVR